MRKVNALEALRIAVEADVCTNTVRHFAEGRRLRPDNERRVRDAAERLGMHDVIPSR